MSKSVYLVVTPFFPSLTSWRGAYCLDFVKALERTGQYDVRVFVPGTGEDYEIDGVKVYRFPTKQLPSNILPFLFSKYNQASFIHKVVASGGDIKDVAICHGHTASYAIYPLAIKAKNPTCQAFLHHHDLQSFGLNLGVLHHCALYNAWLFRRFRKLFEQIDCHVFISEVVKRSFLSAPDASWTIYENYRRQMRGPKLFHCRPVRIKRSLVLHNGVDTSIFHPASRPSTPNSQPSTFTIGCIANFVDLKDQATLIRAMGMLCEKGGIGEKVSDLRVVFVGSGPTLESCKKLAKEIEGKFRCSPSPLTFTFKSEVPHAELADFYRSLDLFVLPSYFEGFGCVLTEAWACGTPFLTCLSQGADDIIYAEDRGMWLFRPQDAAGLMNCIENYFRHRHCQRLSRPVAIDELVRAFVKELANG